MGNYTLSEQLHQYIGVQPALSVLLSRLDRVRQTHPDRWVARCPAHEDREPSLSICSKEDGVILIHCFVGCSIDVICEAVGMELSHLFPPLDKRAKGGPPLPKQHYLTLHECVALLRHHIYATVIAASDLAQGRSLSYADTQELLNTCAIVHRALDEVSP